MSEAASGTGKNPARLYVERVSVPAADEANKWIAERVGTLGGDAFEILQSVGECKADRLAEGGRAEVGETFAGRIFGPNAEIRWVRVGSGYLLWWLSEDSQARRPGDGAASMEEVNCDKPARATRHYLVGYWDDGLGQFREGNIPGEITYSKIIAGNPKKGDRVYVDVVEYFVGEPETGLSFSSEEEIRKFEIELNKPRVIAHRCIGIGCDRDREDGGRRENA